MKDEIDALLESGWDQHRASCELNHLGHFITEQVSADILRIRWVSDGVPSTVTSVGSVAPGEDLTHELQTCGEILSDAGWDYSLARDDHGAYLELSRLMRPLNQAR